MNNVFNIRASLIQLSESPGMVGQLLTVAYFIHRKTMERVASESGLKGLSLVYEGYFAQLIERDHSPAELAEILGVSRQACSRVIKELSAKGLIERHVNPNDARSSLIALSVRGREFVAVSISASREIERELTQEIESEDLDRFISVLKHLPESLDANYKHNRNLQNILSKSAMLPLTVLLPALSNFCYQRLITLLEAKGFRGLKPNFSQVLALIGPEGGRIQQLASMVGVSKQAIAVIAIDLEKLGYITRQADSQDQRQLILKLSPLGTELMTQSVESVNRLTNEMLEALGESTFIHFETMVNTIYNNARKDFEPENIVDIQLEKLSREVLNEHGEAGAQLLANKLLRIAGGIK